MLIPTTISTCKKAIIQLLVLLLTAPVLFSQVPDGLYDIKPANNLYSYNSLQTPANLVSVNTLANTTYQWYSYATPAGAATALGTNETLTFATPLTATTYFKRIATVNSVSYESNLIKLELVSANWEDLNYVRQHTVLVSGKTTWQQVDALPIGQRLESTVYYDGFDRPIQQISEGTATPASGSTTWGDIVKPITYDVFGRSLQGFLPYTTTTNTGKYKSDATTAQAAYYNSIYTDDKPYSTKDYSYEESPLNRGGKIKAAGKSWQNIANGDETRLETNTLAEDVKQFKIGNLETDMPVAVTVASATVPYAENTLFKQVSTDINNLKTIQYFDANGLLLLKKVQLDAAPADNYNGWICTYYVYDDQGQLRCEINPEAVKWLSQNGWSFGAANGTTVFNEQCFVYAYDEKGRTIYKKSPGLAATYLRMVYDARDRLVFMQDGVQRAKSPAEWTVNLYDDLDRVTVTTLYTSTETLAQIKTRALIATPLSATELASTACVVLKRLYYDDYANNSALAFDATAAAAAAIQPGGVAYTKSARTTGMATVSHTRVLGTTTFLITTTYYDEDGNVQQTLDQNLKGGTDITTPQYAWDGRTLALHQKHGMPAQVMDGFTTLTKYDFDLIGRVTATYKKWGTNAWKKVATYAFTDLGRLDSKRLSPDYVQPVAGIGPAGGGLESLAYAYNVQGTLIGINKHVALKESGYNKWSNFFGVFLGYEDNSQLPTNGTTKGLNGQMNGVVWNTMGDDAQRRYNYTYDNAGRLTKAIFSGRQLLINSWTRTPLDFSENSISYDLNGNLQTLTRMGVQLGVNAGVLVDDLSYTYESFSNKLKSVADNSPMAANATNGDFKNNNTTNDDYSYDLNGNLLTDLNKGIKNLGGVAGAAGIKYNYLDKPDEINIPGKGTIKITYDADGAKLKREYIAATGGATKVTWYMGMYQYEEIVGGTTPKALTLEFISFGEGRVRPVTNRADNNGYDALTLTGNISLPPYGTNDKGSIDFFITDHLANTRMPARLNRRDIDRRNPVELCHCEHGNYGWQGRH